MAGKKKNVATKKAAPKPAALPVRKPAQQPDGLYLAIILAGVFFFFFPMLQNGFTNWDDEFYVLKNPLLPGPDWKGIWTQPVAANYHPLTMLSLAFNYGISGVHPAGYLLTNLLLHLLNTVLVYYFTKRLSGNSAWVAAFCAGLFGLHPLHVESVAWVSERKDLLYTFFFLLSLLTWLSYVDGKKKAAYVLSFSLFVFSLLSKPAAVVLPFVLLLVDYMRRRTISWKLVLEKMPFFLASLILGIVTLRAQTVAMSGLAVYTPLDRFLFAGYSTLTYAWKFIVPAGLSVFYPFPKSGQAGAAYWVAPFVILVLFFLVWKARKERSVVFGALFFLVNLVLVVQIVSVGQAIVAERYAYVPFIGLSFALAVWMEKKISSSARWITLVSACLVFGWIARQRTQVWRNSETLWTDAITRFPTAALPRTNRASYLLDRARELPEGGDATALYNKALDDCNAALESEPRNTSALNERGRIRLRQGNNVGAAADGTTLIHAAASNPNGYAIRGKALSGMNKPNEALSDFNKAIELSPNDDNILYDRGALLFNVFGKYNEALNDFDKAIAKQPKGLYFMTRSFCQYKLGNMDKAREDARMAMQQGMTLADNYKALLSL